MNTTHKLALLRRAGKPSVMVFSVRVCLMSGYVRVNERIVAKGTANLDGESHVGDMSVIFLNGEFTINIRNREGLNLYPLNLMLINGLPEGTYTFAFSGPMIGLYHDTKDPREGPYINHYLEAAIVHIKIEPSSVSINITCTADLEKSSFDTYWYSGKKAGIWFLNVGCILPCETKKP